MFFSLSTARPAVSESGLVFCESTGASGRQFTGLLPLPLADPLPDTVIVEIQHEGIQHFKASVRAFSSSRLLSDTPEVHVTQCLGVQHNGLCVHCFQHRRLSCGQAEGIVWMVWM